MGNKYRKPTALHVDAGRRCSLPVVVWGLVGFVVMLHFYSLVSNRDGVGGDIQVRLNLSLTRELEKIEEESFYVPPPRGKRSPRAVKRKPKPKRHTTIIEEFLDENSQLRDLFFPDRKTAIDPTKRRKQRMMSYISKGGCGWTQMEIPFKLMEEGFYMLKP